MCILVCVRNTQKIDNRYPYSLLYARRTQSLSFLENNGQKYVEAFPFLTKILRILPEWNWNVTIHKSVIAVMDTCVCAYLCVCVLVCVCTCVCVYLCVCA